METLVKAQKNGYMFGKVTKLNTNQKLRLLSFLEHEQYDTFVEQILKICVAHQISVCDEIITYKDENFSQYARAFMMGVNNGSLSKDGE